MAPLAVFRCDAGAALGAGHAMRCLAIAGALEGAGWRTAFAVAPGTCEAAPGLDAGSGDVRVVDPDAGPAALASAWPAGADLLVVDHYGFDAALERACRPWARRIFVIDDLANRPHDADWLLDPTPGRDAASYVTLIPATCRVLAGAAFAPMRDEFVRRRAGALARRAAGGNLRRVLVSLGATDPGNVTTQALDALSHAGFDAEIDVVLGSAAPHRDAVARALPERARLSLNVSDLAERIAAADIAIGAAGVSALERCCLGLPTVTVVTAANQRAAASGLDHAGAALVLPEGASSAEDIADGLRKLSGEATRRTMATSAMKLCDGRGVQRLRVALAGTVAADTTTVSLALADAADEALLLAWQHEPGARNYSRNPAAPTAAEHRAWLAGVLADPARMLCLILADGVPCGMLRLDSVAGAAPTFEVSILIAEAFRHRGLGRAALTLARRLAPGARLDAEIHPANAPSRDAFTAAGYVRVADNLFRSEAA